MSHLVEIVLDCRHASKLARFWEVALGWRIRPYDEAEVARLAALEELLRWGATVVSEHDGQRLLADPEGNEFCAKHPD